MNSGKAARLRPSQGNMNLLIWRAQPFPAGVSTQRTIHTFTSRDQQETGNISGPHMRHEIASWSLARGVVLLVGLKSWTASGNSSHGMRTVP